MKFGGLIPNPFNEFLYIIVFEQAVYCVVVITQLSFRKISMNLSMTNAVKHYNFFAFERFWYEMMFAWFFRKRAVAKAAEFNVIHC